VELALPDPGLIALLLIAAAGLGAGVGGGALLRRIPEPRPPDDASPEELSSYAGKIAYRTLATARFRLAAALLAGLGMLIATLTRPAWAWPCWLAFATVAVLLAAIDAASTWLPNPIVHLGWAAMAVGVAVTVVAAAPRGHDPVGLLLTVLGGAAAAGVGYFLLWLLTRGRGVAFGDVRLMPLVGAVAGTMGWAGIYWSVLLGSVVGALVGLVRLVLRRRGAFPYAPALVAGPYAATLLSALV